MENLIKAMERIRPSKEYSSHNGKLVFYKGDDEPTQEEIDAEILLIESEFVASEYQRKRKSDYDKEGLSFDKFVELLIEDDTQGLKDFRDARNLVKVKHPKS